MDSAQNPPKAESNTSAPKDLRPNTPPQTPLLTVDVIIDMGSGLFPLIKRKHHPMGWALPGGFVDVGETVEEAALREVREELGLDIELIRQFHVYSRPDRDDRAHSVSVVFLARGWGEPKAGDDAAGVELFHEMNLPREICFDHHQILRDYFIGRY